MINRYMVIFIMRVISFLLALVALCGALCGAHALRQDFQQCAQNPIVSIESITLTPSEPIIGEDLSVVVNGNSSQEISHPMANIVASVLGINVLKQQFNLCKYIACPIQSNKAFVVNLTQMIPADIPSGLTVDIQIQIISTKVVGCVDVIVETIKHNLNSYDYSKTLYDYWNKQFEQPPSASRYETFVTNLHNVMINNMNYHNYVVDHKLALNRFATMTSDEFNQMKGLQISKPIEPPIVKELYDLLPDSVDWVAKGVLGEVKNQGQCGSCYSFSTIGSLEGLYTIKTGKQISFSEQQIVDCSTSFGNEGCNGGSMDQSFQYIMKNGITTESSYPYTAVESPCHLNGSMLKFISGFVDVPHNNELQLKQAVALQPVSVAIEADQQTFQFYQSGIIGTSSCGTNLDHGVVVVGYGVDSVSGKKYWKVRNSWGSAWGDKGYVLLERTDSPNGSGTCGVAMMASYPTFIDGLLKVQEGSLDKFFMV